MAIRIQAITALPDFAPLQTFWQANQWHPNADWDFYRVIVQTRTAVLAPCAFVVFDGTEIVALLAARIEATNLPIHFGYATMANPSVRQLVCIDGGFIGAWEPGLYRLLLEFLRSFLVGQRLDLALISQVRMNSPLHGVLLEGPRRHRAVPTRDVSLHWLMRLPKTWPEFLAARSKKHRYWLKRLNNTMDRDFPGTWTIQVFSSEAQAPVFLRAAEKVADTTYHRGLGVGLCADEQNLRRLSLEGARGQLRGYLLLIKEKPCAFWYCATFGQTLHLCSTGYNSALRNYELGTILLMKVFQDHCGSITDTVDFGLGDAGYKQRFGTESYTESTFLVFSRTSRGSLLRAAIAVKTQCNDLTRRLLDKLQLTQLLKTFWRKKISARHAESPYTSQDPAKSALSKSDET